VPRIEASQATLDPFRTVSQKGTSRKLANTEAQR
jgi:hypothetical protein